MGCRAMLIHHQQQAYQVRVHHFQRLIVQATHIRSSAWAVEQYSFITSRRRIRFRVHHFQETLFSERLCGGGNTESIYSQF